MNDFFDDYIEKLNRKCVICPRPPVWAKISTKIFKASPELKDEREYQPLILGAWAYTSDKQKNDRFKKQLKLAYKNNTLNNVISYLQKLDLNKDFERDKFPLCDSRIVEIYPRSNGHYNMIRERLLLRTMKWVHLLFKSSNDFNQKVDPSIFLNERINDFLKLKQKPKKFSSNQSLALHKISEIYLKQNWFNNLEVFCSDILELKDDLLFKYR